MATESVTRSILEMRLPTLRCAACGTHCACDGLRLPSLLRALADGMLGVGK